MLRRRFFMQNVNIGMTSEHRQKICAILNQIVADLSVLYVKTRNYHWNVEGMQFGPLHELFEHQYDHLAETIDEVAERVRMLGGRPIGTMVQFLEHATLKEHPSNDHPDALTMLANLVADHESCIRFLREAVDTCDQYHDMGTNDFLTGLMEQQEKTAWMLRSHLGT
ncbi:MAG: DNA starvation/stationary phase protection protein [Chloroflexaceae bacterium]|nr:DNA starvation/stationary phase protection protein [Chloroflexaceae bacterium]